MKLALLFCLFSALMVAQTLSASCDPCAVNTPVLIYGSGYTSMMAGNSHTALSITIYCGTNPTEKGKQPTIFYFLANTDAGGNFSGLRSSPNGAKSVMLSFPPWTFGMECEVYAQVPINEGAHTIWENVAEIEIGVQ